LCIEADGSAPRLLNTSFAIKQDAKLKAGIYILVGVSTLK